MYKHLAKSNSRLPEMGVGITYSPELEPLLEQRPELFPVLEIEPQTMWIETGQAPRRYRTLEKVFERLAGLPGSR